MIAGGGRVDNDNDIWLIDRRGVSGEGREREGGVRTSGNTSRKRGCVKFHPWLLAA